VRPVLTDRARGLDEIYRRHAPSVFRRALRLLGNEADAQEVVQDVFLQLFERPEQYAGRSALTTYLYSVTTHACLSRIRNQKNRSRLLQQRSASSDGEPADRSIPPDELYRLHEALRRMPEMVARVAIHYYIDDLSHAEIAELVGCSRRQVGNLLEHMEAWGREEEAQSCC
jgi:RNA polymerase sigma-70 factor, ECF subfamily